ncbi:MAG: transposase [Caldilineaceae bacterium]
MITRRKYTADFKRRIIDEVLYTDRSQAEVEREYGIGAGCISRWIREVNEQAENAFPGNGNRPGAEADVARLQRALAAAQEENVILKKALAIVSHREASALP